LARAWAGFNLFHVNLVEALKNRKVQIGIAAAAILLAAALTLVWIFQPKNNSDASANPSTAATPSTHTGVAGLGSTLAQAVEALPASAVPPVAPACEDIVAPSHSQSSALAD